VIRKAFDAYAHPYSVTELWDAMLGGPKQSGHSFSRSGPSSFSYLNLEVAVSSVEPRYGSPSLALIFDVNRVAT
jgi:hypothetical protein